MNGREREMERGKREIYIERGVREERERERERERGKSEKGRNEKGVFRLSRHLTKLGVKMKRRKSIHSKT
jgi:hypothetical protein